MRDPNRETSNLFLHKNMAWLRGLKEELGTQYHGRRFGVWRWEQAVAQCHGDEWVKLAQNSIVWRSKLEYVNWLIALVLKLSDTDVLSVQ